MDRTEWLLCLICDGKIREPIRKDAILKKYPPYYPRSYREQLIDSEILFSFYQKKKLFC
ncbi:MAG: conjugal transfer protein [Ruminococcaceae bacterium]|nr:conjugal transfer protein [Oscillospiraceae bacterium]